MVEKERKVSIIVPVYNVEKYLAECIEAILHQSFCDFELILVDDGSSDQSGKICDDYSLRDKRIVVMHKKNGGVSSARNEGLERSKGRYIAFVDSDDIIDELFLEILVGTIEQSGADVVQCGYKRFYKDKIVDSTKTNKEAKVVSSDELRSGLFGENSFACAAVWNKLYKRETIGTLRFEPNRIHEDTYFINELCLRMKGFALVEDELYFYRVVSNSLLHSNFSKRNLDICWLHQTLADEYLNENNNELYYLSRHHYIRCLKYMFIKAQQGGASSDDIDYLRKEAIETYGVLNEGGKLGLVGKAEYAMIKESYSMFSKYLWCANWIDRIKRKCKSLWNQ